MRNFFNPAQMSRGSMVVAILALCVAMAGGAYAANNIGKGAVEAKNIANGAVSAKKIQKGAIAKRVVITQVSGGNLSVGANKSAATTAACPNGTQAISGGAEQLNPSNGTSDGGSIESSFRSSNVKNWTLRIDNPGSAKTFAVSALCIKIN